MSRRAVVAALALTASGCFAINDPDAHLPGPIPAEELCARYAEVVCGDALNCCLGAGVIDAMSRQACVEAVGVGCNDAFAPIANDPRAGYDPAEAARQLTIGADLGSRCSPEYFEWASRSGGLLAMFAGTVGRGGDCAPLAGERTEDPSSPRFFSCEDGLACAPTAGGWTCGDRRREGEECATYTPGCVDGLVCLDRTCQPLLADGQPCWTSGECASAVCAHGIPIEPDQPDGRCLPRSEGFCHSLGLCPESRIGYFGAAGPVAEGFSCDIVVACLDDPADESTLTTLGWQCGPGSTLGSSCPGIACFYDDDGRMPFEGPGELSAEEVAEICGAARLASVRFIVCSEPVAP